MIFSYHAVPTEEEMFFISRPLQASRFFVGTRLFSKQKTAFQGAGAVGNRKNFPEKTLV